MPATSERPAEAFEATKPPYECATRIFGPAIASRVDRTIVTSLLAPCRPRAGVTVAYPSLWSPATTRSHADGAENAPCTRTIVGRRRRRRCCCAPCGSDASKDEREDRSHPCQGAAPRCWGCEFVGHAVAP